MRTYFLTLFTLLQFVLPIHAQQTDWVYSNGGHRMDYVFDVKSDLQGNTYVSGMNSPFATYGNTTYSNYGHYLIKLDSAGNLLWKNYAYINMFTEEILIDSNGDIIMIGRYNTLPSVAMQLINYSNYTMIRKFDSNGNLLSHTVLSNLIPGEIVTNGAALDTNDNLYLTGYFLDDINFDGSATAVGQDYFILKLDHAMNPVWMKKGGGAGSDLGVEIKYHNNALYVICNTSSKNPMQFGQFSYHDNGFDEWSSFLLKYDLNGNVEWLNGKIIHSGQSNVVAQSLDISPTGAIYIGGFVEQNVIFEPNVHLNASKSTYIARFDNNGNALWAKNLKNTITDNYRIAIRSDSNDNVYFTTNFENSQTTPTYTLTSSGLTDITWSKYNAIGYPQWGRKAGGSRKDFGSSIDLDQNNHLLVGGSYLGMDVYFDNIYVPTHDDDSLSPTSLESDFFAAKISNILPDTCPIDSVFIYASSLDYCEGDTLELTVNNPYAIFIEWFKNGELIDNGTKRKFIIDKLGTYSVRINENTACKMPSAPITIIEKPNPILELPKDTSICKNDSILIQPITNGVFVNWSDDHVGFSHQLAAGTSTNLTAHLNDCRTEKSIYIGALELPTIELLLDHSNTFIASGGIWYDWFWEQNLIASSNQNTFAPIDYGRYSVIGANEEGCENIAFWDIDFKNCMDINIYPNPSKGRFNISTRPEKIMLITIYNSAGQLMFQLEGNLQTFQEIKLQKSLATGNYIVIVETEECSFIERLMILK